MKEKNPIELVEDMTSDLNLRIPAIDNLPQDIEKIVLLLSNQLEEEISEDDTSFIIYLLGAIRRNYDSRFIPSLIKLLKLSDIEITFRIQCVHALSCFGSQSLPIFFISNSICFRK